MAKLQTIACDRGGLLGLATLIVYAILAPTTIVDGENAEFSTLAITGGAAHPSGYPLYVLYLRAMSWLPGVTPAHTAALATALVAALATVMLHAACRSWGARAGSAAVACGLVAGAPIVLRMYTQAEVFALNGLAVATILWLAGPAAPVRGPRRVILLAFVGGLALTNHLTAALLAPVGAYGCVAGFRETTARRLLVACGAVLAFVVGLLPYVYLLIATSQVSWGRIDGLGPLVDHVARRAYGGVAGFGPVGENVSAWQSIGALGVSLGRSWLWAPLVLGIAGLAIGIARGPARVAWGCLAATIALTGPLLVARFNIPPEPGLYLYVCERFHILPTILFAVPIAVGLDRLVLARTPRLSSWFDRRAFVIAAIACFGIATLVSLPGLRRDHSPALERGLRFALASAPNRAVVLTSGDAFDNGGAYLQHAVGFRTDLTLINVDMMGASWYRERVGRALGIPMARNPQPEAALVRAALATGRLLAVDYRIAPRVRGHAMYPVGVLVRVLPPGVVPPPLDAIVADNQALYAALDLDYPPPRTDDDWSADMHRQYEYVWRVLARALESAHDASGAADARRLAEALAPRPP